MNTDMDAALALNYIRAYTTYITKRNELYIFIFTPAGLYSGLYFNLILGQLIIHGACLEAYCCIQACLRIGIDTKRIIVVTVPGDEMSWEKLHGYRDTVKV